MADAPSTVFVLVCDEPYFHKAQRTIQDLRAHWDGDVVLVPIRFEPDGAWAATSRVELMSLPVIFTDGLTAAYAAHPFTKGDGRHLTKQTQWQKLLAFHPDFQSRWRRLVFLDAGVRVFGPVTPWLDLAWEDRFICHDDDPGRVKPLSGQLDLAANPTLLPALLADFGPAVLDARTFLNCVWIVDTALFARGALLDEMVAVMNDYPICLCNEMTVMTLVLHVRHGVWVPFPLTRDPSFHKYYFSWSEANAAGTTWRDYVAVKYSSTVPW